MRLASERRSAKMAAGSDLLDNSVFSTTEGDAEEVRDAAAEAAAAAGSRRSDSPPGAAHAGAAAGVRCAASEVGDTASNSSVRCSQTGLSQRVEAGTTVPGGVINCTGSLRSDVDGAVGTPSPALAQSTPATAVGPDASVSSLGGKPEGSNVQTSNGSVANSQTGESSDGRPQPTVALPTNGPVPTSKGSAAAIIWTPGQNTVTFPVISSQATTNAAVPMVALVRPPVHTPTPPRSAAPIVAPRPTLNATKTIMQTGGYVPASAAGSGTTVTVRSATVLQNMRTTVPSAVSTASPGAPRAVAPQALAPRLAQPQPQNGPSVQNFQLPPGMVLIRSESGQLLMIHQQTLAQLQAQSQSQGALTPRPAPTSTPPVQVTSLQAPATSLLPRSVAPTTIIKQASTGQTTVTSTRPQILQNTVVIGGAATTTTAPGQPLGTSTSVPVGSTVTTRVAPPRAPGTALAPIAVSAETLENVKKCSNFLSTLIKLASGKQSSETTANVKELIKNLLEAKLEPEDFTSRLYRELNSSPQPYLVPFLKRSLPALRQMTPDSEAFIQQSLMSQPCSQAGGRPTAAASTALTAAMLRPTLSTLGSTSTTSTTTATRSAAVSPALTTPHSKPVTVVQHQQHQQHQHQGTTVTLSPSPMVTMRGQTHGRIILGQTVKPVQTVKHSFAAGVKGGHVVSLAATQKNSLKEAGGGGGGGGGGGSFRDDEEINDVASMAGVNLSEESARMAISSEHVGSVTRSCKDDPFLSSSSLTCRVLDIGKKFGIREIPPDVISYISHATQMRLQNVLEKVTHVAQQKSCTSKGDGRSEQVSDVRAQLKFFEQLDQMEKQRKEEQEREILLKAAKSRSRQEDPEQLRLKQKAKEMQQQELAQIRQREANLTALAAIGPRKKRKTQSPVRGSSAEDSGSGPSTPAGSGGATASRQFLRHRITRVNLRDLLLCLEDERGASHSHLLYKGFLK